MNFAASSAKPEASHPKFLEDDRAVAAIVLWKSGYFDTHSIAQVLGATEDAVCRTLHLAKSAAGGQP